MVARSACGFGDLDDPRHSWACLTCQSVLRRERCAAAIEKVARPWAERMRAAAAKTLGRPR